MPEEEIGIVIGEKVRTSLGGTCWHRPEILSRLVSPRKKPFLVDLDWDQSVEFWLIYEESTDGIGYKIVFEDSTGRYGLAVSVPGSSHDLVLGFYESLREVLSSIEISES